LHVAEEERDGAGRESAFWSLDADGVYAGRCASAAVIDENRRMADAAPWSRFRSEVYALIGRNPRSNRLLPSIADLHRSHAALDIGCGPGAAVRAAAGSVARAVGVDRSLAMIEIARRRSRRLHNVEFTVGGAELLPFSDATFDRLWTIHSFHHWEDPTQGIAECLRVLRPHGRLLIVENDTTGAHGLDRRRAVELADELRTAGFADATVSKPHRQLVVTGICGV
jgi:ubiquinone/menaquinone biosynthesis C-methylase UbiE